MPVPPPCDLIFLQNKPDAACMQACKMIKVRLRDARVCLFIGRVFMFANQFAENIHGPAGIAWPSAAIYWSEEMALSERGAWVHS